MVIFPNCINNAIYITKLSFTASNQQTLDSFSNKTGRTYRSVRYIINHQYAFLSRDETEEIYFLGGLCLAGSDHFDQHIDIAAFDG